MSNSEKYGFNKHIHIYLTDQIRFSDDKAKSVFTISAGILIYLFNKESPDFQSLLLHGYIGEWGIRVLLYLSIFFLFLSTILSLKVIYPNLAGSSRGFVFFQSISMFNSSNEYFSEINNMPIEEVNEGLVKHNYELASVLTKKYKNLNKSFSLGVSGFMLMLLYLFILSLNK